MSETNPTTDASVKPENAEVTTKTETSTDPNVATETTTTTTTATQPEPKKKKKMWLLIIPLIFLFLCILCSGVTFFLVQADILKVNFESWDPRVSDEGDSSDSGDQGTDEEPATDDTDSDIDDEVVFAPDQLYTNKNYPELKIYYDKSWNLSEKVTPANGITQDFDSTEVTFTKDGVSLVYLLEPVAGIGGVAQCYKYSEIDYTWLDAEWVRIANATDYNYHIGLVDREHNKAGFEEELGYFHDYSDEPFVDSEMEACGTIINIVGTTPTTYKLEGMSVGAVVEIRVKPKALVTDKLLKEADEMVGKGAF